MIDILGWTGGILLAVCGIPQAIQCVRQGHASGIDGLFLLLWTVGELLCLAYVLFLDSLPLVINYVANSIACLVISYYKWRKTK